MRKQSRRGFTLVELVIVIAVIAILAGVMIATFANVVKKAEDSRKLQEAKQDEINQKIEDITAKLENADWLGWEDFENELASQLTASDANTDEAINNTLEEYEKKYAQGNTSLTEAQVKTIIERTMNGELTQAQIETIVRKYTAELNGGASTSQIQKIVNAAMANQLTAPQVSRLMKELVAQGLVNLDSTLSTFIINIKEP